MLSRIASLPFRAARRIARLVLGRSNPPPAYTAPPREWTEPAHEHEHAHEHDHGHEHEHEHAHEPREVHVRAEETPNPSAMKFVTGVPVGAFDLSAPEQAEEHALARALFEIEGVKAVFGRNDFVTVTKIDEARWDALVPKVTRAIETALR